MAEMQNMILKQTESFAQNNLKLKSIFFNVYR